jgi:hypothetical protein
VLFSVELQGPSPSGAYSGNASATARPTRAKKTSGRKTRSSRNVSRREREPNVVEPVAFVTHSTALAGEESRAAREPPPGLLGPRAGVQECVHGGAMEEAEVRAPRDCKFESQQLEERALGQGEPLLREIASGGKLCRAT